MINRELGTIIRKAGINWDVRGFIILNKVGGIPIIFARDVLLWYYWITPTTFKHYRNGEISIFKWY